NGRPGAANGGGLRNRRAGGTIIRSCRRGHFFHPGLAPVAASGHSAATRPGEKLMVFDGTHLKTLSGAAKLAGVVSWPVEHSRSPRLHGLWLAKYNVDGAYVPLPVSPDHLHQVLQTLPMLGFRGVNLTVP